MQMQADFVCLGVWSAIDTAEMIFAPLPRTPVGAVGCTVKKVTMATLVEPSVDTFSFVATQLIAVPVAIPDEGAVERPPGAVPDIIRPPWEVHSEVRHPGTSMPGKCSTLKSTCLSGGFSFVKSLNTGGGPTGGGVVAEIKVGVTRRFQGHFIFVCTAPFLHPVTRYAGSTTVLRETVTDTEGGASTYVVKMSQSDA